MATQLRGQLFAPETVKDLFNKVQGHSSLAKLSQQIPVAFNGNDIFTFAMDNEVNLVAEDGVKAAGGITVDSVKVTPYKIEYGARVTDEFMYGAEEKQLDILRGFNEGFAKKVARGLDIMAIHGLNPRTNTAATNTIGTKHFDSMVQNVVTYDATDPDGNIESAIAMIADYANVNGVAIDKTMAGALAALKVNGVKQYPQLAWGANPGQLNGCNLDVNSTVAVVATGGTADKALVGDFEYFKWGFAKEIPLEVIEYGDPDQSGSDLKAHNQVYLRAEVYIGWAILDADAFAIVR